MNYTKTYLQKKKTVQDKLPGKDMKKNLAGGYAFKADDFVALQRWLITGSMTNAYYSNSDTMTEEAIDLLQRCINADAVRTSKEIVYASDYGIKNSTPILALVFLSMGNFSAKNEFKNIFNKVVRTASHLYEFISYTKNIRGMGRVIHKAIQGWLKARDTKELEYQFLKYQQRNGWSARDILRLIKPLAKTSEEDLLYAWVVGKREKADPINLLRNGFERIEAYERLKTDDLSEAEVIEMITKFNLTQEMIPGNVVRTSDVWEALFQRMPVTATMRNLANLTNKGIFNNVSNLDVLENRFSKENIKRARLHPLTIANGYATYIRGRGFKGSLVWQPIPRVSDILEDAIENGFDILEPTNSRIFHALDISGSMASYSGSGLQLNCRDISGIMALATIRSEKNYFVGGFSHYFVNLPKFTKKTTFNDILRNEHLGGLSFGGTNASLAYKYALENNIVVDAFVLWTDNMTWVGDHPTEALKEYRKYINENAKAIYVTIAPPYPDYITLVDPSDKKSYDIVGFSDETPKIIHKIITNEL